MFTPFMHHAMYSAQYTLVACKHWDIEHTIVDGIKRAQTPLLSSNSLPGYLILISVDKWGFLHIVEATTLTHTPLLTLQSKDTKDKTA